MALALAEAPVNISEADEETHWEGVVQSFNDLDSSKASMIQNPATLPIPSQMVWVWTLFTKENNRHFNDPAACTTGVTTNKYGSFRKFIYSSTYVIDGRPYQLWIRPSTKHAKDKDLYLLVRTFTPETSVTIEMVPSEHAHFTTIRATWGLSGHIVWSRDFSDSDRCRAMELRVAIKQAMVDADIISRNTVLKMFMAQPQCPHDDVHKEIRGNTIVKEATTKGNGDSAPLRGHGSYWSGHAPMHPASEQYPWQADVGLSTMARKTRERLSIRLKGKGRCDSAPLPGSRSRSPKYSAKGCGKGKGKGRN